MASASRVMGCTGMVVVYIGVGFGRTGLKSHVAISMLRYGLTHAIYTAIGDFIAAPGSTSS
jgi:hypothetical protein